MRAVGVVRVACLVVLMVVAACGGSGKPGPSVSTGPTDDGGADLVCVDNDGDGYGLNCTLGTDCDDEDPTVTDECRRCAGATSTGCPCTPGTKTLSCMPPVKHVTGGTLVCREGNRYCRDGLWSACETIGEYVFMAGP
jgi:hypothetical protein